MGNKNDNPVRDLSWAENNIFECNLKPGAFYCLNINTY